MELPWASESVHNAPLDQTLVNLKLMGAIDNDLSVLGEYMQKAHEYTEVPLQGITLYSDKMHLKPVLECMLLQSSRR